MPQDLGSARDHRGSGPRGSDESDVSHELLIRDFYARLDEDEPLWISPAKRRSLRLVRVVYTQSHLDGIGSEAPTRPTRDQQRPHTGDHRQRHGSHGRSHAHQLPLLADPGVEPDKYSVASRSIGALVYGLPIRRPSNGVRHVDGTARSLNRRRSLQRARQHAGVLEPLLSRARWSSGRARHRHIPNVVHTHRVRQPSRQRQPPLSATSSTGGGLVACPLGGGVALQARTASRRRRSRRRWSTTTASGRAAADGPDPGAARLRLRRLPPVDRPILFYTEWSGDRTKVDAGARRGAAAGRADSTRVRCG
jgi:hypothetical protein